MFDKESKKVQKTEETHLKRIEIFDFLRGMTILFMLLFHGFEFYEANFQQTIVSGISDVLIGAVSFIARWAGLFALISGLVNGYVSYSYLISKRATKRQIVFGQLYYALWLLILKFIRSALFGRRSVGGGIYNFEEGPINRSLLTGYLETGSFPPISLFNTVNYMDALTMIGGSVIISTILLVIFYHKVDEKTPLRIMITFSVLGTIIILISSTLLAILRSIWVDALIEENYWISIFCGFLIGDTHPMFPFLGYAFYGVVLGIAATQKDDVKRITIKYTTLTGILYCIGGIIAYSFLGSPPLAYILQPPCFQATLLQIGLMLLLVARLYYMQFFGRNTWELKIYRNRAFRRFGITSLTIYALEPFIGTLIKVMILDKLFPDWALIFINIVLYSFGLLLFWHLLLLLWEKRKFAGSFEWLTGKILQFASKRPLSRKKSVESLYISNHIIKNPVNK